MWLVLPEGFPGALTHAVAIAFARAWNWGGTSKAVGCVAHGAGMAGTAVSSVSEHAVRGFTGRHTTGLWSAGVRHRLPEVLPGAAVGA